MEMKERPILFSGPMVEAILEGRKTQTRRPIKPQPSDGLKFAGWVQTSTVKKDEGKAAFMDEIPLCKKVERISCPYGKPDEQLWVRETHYRYGHWIGNGKAPTGRKKWKFKPLTDEVLYFDNAPAHIEKTAYRKEAWYKRPSIFMPRGASRIQLEVISIRVERLQSISETDAVAEGIRSSLSICYELKHLCKPYQCKNCPIPDHIGVFKSLWESINGADSWAANPWVWVVEFKLIKRGAQG